MRLCKGFQLTVMIAGLVLLLFSTGCRRGETAAVPRPVAYPRIEVPEAEYVVPDSLPLHFEINAGADSERRQQEGMTWLTITYPDNFADVALYCTFSPVTPATLDDVVANRTERMALNTGGADSEVTQLVSSGGFDCTMTVTRAGSATPVQFLAADMSMVVSGTMYINVEAGFAPDSIAPVVDAVARDVLHSLKTLRYGN